MISSSILPMVSLRLFLVFSMESSLIKTTSIFAAMFPMLCSIASTLLVSLGPRNRMLRSAILSKCLEAFGHSLGWGNKIYLTKYFMEWSTKCLRSEKYFSAIHKGCLRSILIENRSFMRRYASFSWTMFLLVVWKVATQAANKMGNEE